MTKTLGYSLLFGLCMATTALTALPAGAQEQATIIQQKTGIGLDEAIAQTLQNAPEIAKSKALIEAAVGARSQASAMPNPELSLEAENVAGTGAFSGVDGAETTVSISQTIELGGKISARKAMADRDLDLTYLSEQETTLALIGKVKSAYARVAAAQERIILAQSEYDLADDILSGVTRRVNAAAEPLYQKNKATIAKSTAQLARTNAQRERDAAIDELTLLTGITVSSVHTVDFYQIEPLPEMDNALVDKSIVARRETLEVDKANTAFDLEKANAVPDPTFNLGVRNFREEEENALVLGVSMPLPVLNLNRGNIRRASQEVVARDAQRNENLRDARGRVVEAHQQASNAYEEARAIAETILPQAEAALKETRRGYDAGAFAYLEVLDAQRTLADVKKAHLDALSRYHAERAEWELLTAPATNPQ